MRRACSGWQRASAQQSQGSARRLLAVLPLVMDHQLLEGLVLWASHCLRLGTEPLPASILRSQEHCSSHRVVGFTW